MISRQPRNVFWGFSWISSSDQVKISSQKFYLPVEICQLINDEDLEKINLTNGTWNIEENSREKQHWK